MQIIEKYKSQLEKKLDEKNAFTDTLTMIEAKTGVKKMHLAGGLTAFILIYLVVGYGAQFLANFIGFLYPAYCSVKAIETKEKDDDTKWLTYWVVYAAFSLLEFFTDIFLFWIPLYALLKCLFLVYCMAPTSWNGSLMIYLKFIRPFILKHQNNIDSAINKVTNAASDLAEEVFGLTKRRLIEESDPPLNDIENVDEEVETLNPKEESKLKMLTKHLFTSLGLGALF